MPDFERLSPNGSVTGWSMDAAQSREDRHRGEHRCGAWWGGRPRARCARARHGHRRVGAGDARGRQALPPERVDPDRRRGVRPDHQVPDRGSGLSDHGVLSLHQSLRGGGRRLGLDPGRESLFRHPARRPGCGSTSAETATRAAPRGSTMSVSRGSTTSPRPSRSKPSAGRARDSATRTGVGSSSTSKVSPTRGGGSTARWSRTKSAPTSPSSAFWRTSPTPRRAGGGFDSSATPFPCAATTRSICVR